MGFITFFFTTTHRYTTRIYSGGARIFCEEEGRGICQEKAETVAATMASREQRGAGVAASRQGQQYRGQGGGKGAEKRLGVGWW